MLKILAYADRALTLIICLYMIFFIKLSPPPGLGGSFSIPHLLLVMVTVGISAAAWKLPMMGGLLFFIFGFRFYIMIAYSSPTIGSIILGVFMLTAVLFLAEGYLRSRLEK